MSLRLIEAYLPSSALDDFPDLLTDCDYVHLWKSDLSDAGALLHILLESDAVEEVSDLLVDHYGKEDEFRLVFLPAEATLPKVATSEKEAESEGNKQGGNDKQNNNAKRGVRRVSREELYEDLSRSSKLTAVYLLMVVLSTVVAAIGIMRDDVAIIVGAMVIAPLLGPNVGLSLSAALGDRELARQALKATGVGVATAASLSVAMGMLIKFDPAVQAIVQRTQPGLSDIALALAAGTAGALAFTSGVPSVVVGVMVAVALLPPLVVAGLMAGAGSFDASLGALTIVLTNITCVNLSAMGTFFLLNVRPRSWWEADRARKATRYAGTAWVVLLGVLLALMLWGPFAPLTDS